MPENRDQPDPSVEAQRLAHIRVLNNKLPTKRLIAQGLARNEAGDILLCELTYKAAWDLPGGVVDPLESPATCVSREVHEELDLRLPAGDLLAVNWLPPYRGWDDALLCLYDLGTHPSDIIDGAQLERREIRSLAWCSLDALDDRVAAYTARMIRSVLATASGATAYLEDGLAR